MVVQLRCIFAKVTSFADCRRVFSTCAAYRSVVATATSVSMILTSLFRLCQYHSGGKVFESVVHRAKSGNDEYHILSLFQVPDFILNLVLQSLYLGVILAATQLQIRSELRVYVSAILQFFLQSSYALLVDLFHLHTDCTGACRSPAKFAPNDRFDLARKEALPCCAGVSPIVAGVLGIPSNSLWRQELSSPFDTSCNEHAEHHESRGQIVFLGTADTCPLPAAG